VPYAPPNPVLQPQKEVTARVPPSIFYKHIAKSESVKAIEWERILR